MSQSFEHSSPLKNLRLEVRDQTHHERSLSASKLLFQREFSSSKDLRSTRTKLVSSHSIMRPRQTLNSIQPVVPDNTYLGRNLSQHLDVPRSLSNNSRISMTSVHCIHLAGDCEPFPEMSEFQSEISTPKRSFSTQEPCQFRIARDPNLSKIEESKHAVQIQQPVLSKSEAQIEEDKQIERVCMALADNDRFKIVKKKKYRMYHRKEANKTITLKFEGELEIELKNLFKLLYETEIYHLWFPNCRKATLLHTFNMQKRMLKSELMTPGLMADRQNIMLSMFCNRLASKDCIYVLARSVHHLEEIDSIPVPKLGKGKVKLDVQFFGFQIEPTSRSSAIVRSVFNFHPHVKFVPQWLLNIVNKHFGKMLFERMMKYSLSLKGTKIEKKLAKLEESQFYEWINNQLLKYYDRKGW